MAPREFSRAQRVSGQIRRELADLLARSAGDPRFEAVTLSEVELSRDLAHAKVYVTLHPDSEVQPTIAALNRAAGFLRGRLGRRLRMRALPQLRFVYDPTLDNADRVSALIDAAVAGDARTEGTGHGDGDH